MDYKLTLKPILTILLLCSLTCKAKTYNPTTVAQINGYALQAGDTVKMVGNYSGAININSNGITIIGTQATLTGTVRSGKNNLTIYGLNFSDTPKDKNTIASVKYGIDLGSEGSKVTGCKFINCKFSYVGIGINMFADNMLIDSCTFENLLMVVNDPGGDNDYGANPVVLSGNNNTITHNKALHCWAFSFDYTMDGGAVEMWGSCSNNIIAYNFIYDCCGVCEFGSDSNVTCDNNLFAYNICINNGGLTWINYSGQYAVKVSNVKYWNNVIVENTASRFGQPFGYTLFNYGGTPQVDTVFNLKNNVFIISNGYKFVNSSSKTFHANNIYKLSGGSQTNYTLGATEKNTTANIFNDVSNSDATKWDYHVSTSSPAYNFGQNLSLPFDYFGIKPDATPNAGIAEVSTPLAIDTTTHTGPIQATGITVRYDRQTITITSDRTYAYAYWQLVNVLGQVVSKGEYRQGVTRVSIEGLASAIYFLKTDRKTYKIIKNGR